MKRIILFALAGFLAACSPAAMSEDDLMAAIQEREDAFSAAFNAADPVALGDIYEEDAVLVPPGSPPVYGRAAAVETMSGLFGVLLDVELIASNVRPMGADYAVEVGQGTYDTIGEDGTRATTTIDYVITWHKGDDGVWRYTTDIFNAHDS